LLVLLVLISYCSVHTHAQQPNYEPSDAVRTRLKPIVEGIISAWDKFDVVCLGEDHGSKNDSDLRLALVQHPAFARKVRVVMVESANIAHQDVLDRFTLDLEEMSRDKLQVVWADASGSEVWAAPIYETFLRAIQKVNTKLPREQRVRVLGGDDPKHHNRGGFIRDEVAKQILEKNLKGLTIYGAGHCECRGGGYPGEIGDKYPGRIFAAFNFYDVAEGKRVFNLGDEPQLIQITGTPRANMPSGRMFFLGRVSADPLGYIANAIVYFGDIKDSKVPAPK
jgi:hypothetical protein